mmetsp:Transcript_20900/g.33963  ORF Transcript_20900/g.33963 Transcript_20900/m.33963 type:complete len:388 (-) Transcript_20900:301-1464(-)
MAKSITCNTMHIFIYKPQRLEDGESPSYDLISPSNRPPIAPPFFLLKRQTILPAKLENNTLLNPSVKLGIIGTQRDAHGLVAIVHATPDRLKHCEERPVLPVPGVHPGTVPAVLRKVNVLPTRSEQILIGLRRERTLPVKLPPGDLDIVRHLLQIEDDQLEILLRHEVQFALVVLDPLGISIVLGSRLARLVLVVGPFEVPLIENVQERRVPVGLQRSPSAPARRESTQASVVVVLGREEDGLVGIRIVDGDALVSSSPFPSQLGHAGGVSVWIDLPALTLGVFLAAYPGVPGGESSTAVVGGAGEEGLVLEDVAVLVEVYRVHSSVAILLLAVDHVRVSALGWILRIQGYDSRGIGHGMVGFRRSIAVGVGNALSLFGDDAHGEAR